jgi:hypothetical protein
MSLSTEEYANLSKDAYKAPIWDSVNQEYQLEHINGIAYKPLDYMSDPATGYQGTIYRRVDTGEIVVAHRGTQPPTEDIHDTITDAAMVFARVNPQVRDAEALTRQALEYARNYAAKTHSPVSQVTTTGHSLGGTLAQITAHEFHLHAETFNPYGAVSLGYGLQPGQDDIVNHVMAADPVSAASPQPGQVRMYASGQEVRSVHAVGYTNDHAPSPLRAFIEASSPVQTHIVRPAEAAIDNLGLGAHGISNFATVDDQNRPKPSVLIDPQAQPRAAQYSTMFEKYRADALAIRSGLSQPGDTVTHAMKAVDHAVTRAQDTFLHDALNLSNAANRALDRVSQGMKTADQAVMQTMHAADRAVTRAQDAFLHGTLNLSNAANQALDRVGLGPPARQFSSVTAPALLRIDQPGHSGHAVFSDIQARLDTLNAKEGVRMPQRQRDQLAASLAAQGHEDFLFKKAEQLVVSGDGKKLGVVQNYPVPAHGFVDVAQGMNTPIEQSTQQWDQTSQQREQQHQEWQQQQAQQQAHGMSVGR